MQRQLLKAAIWKILMGLKSSKINVKREHDVIAHESRFPQETSSMSVIWTRVTGEASRHGLFPREPPVVKGMHVNHLLCFDDGGWLGFLFPPSLASQRHPELLHHAAAEQALRTEEQTRQLLSSFFMHKTSQKATLRCMHQLKAE